MATSSSKIPSRRSLVVCGAGPLEPKDFLTGSGKRCPLAVERAEGLLVENLLAWGHAVYPVSPKISARARERYQAAAKKDDHSDALVLARHPPLRDRVLAGPCADERDAG